MFHRTQVHGDVYDARHIQIDGSIFTLQRVRDVATGRLLTLREMLLHESRYSDERHMERLGLELVKNTRADLLGAMAEMVERLAGRWVDDPERVHRQATYRAIVAEYSSEPTWMGRGWPSDRFLIDNPDLLE
jgi:putative glycosyltransferase (TIGR04372 family)